MTVLIVADESVDFAIIRTLRATGFDIYSITENDQGSSDSQVLEIAWQLQAILLTEDKDFGELTYRLRRPTCGIVLVRLPELDGTAKAAIVHNFIVKSAPTLVGCFIVIDIAKVRVRFLHV